MQETPFVLLSLTDTLTVAFRVDAPGLAFLVLVVAMWTVAGIYALRYKDHLENNGRFFAFYLLTLVMLVGLSFAANYMTLYLFFEMMTLFSVPLVLHDGTAEAVSAAKKYLFYSIFGATLGLLGFFFIHAYGTTGDFMPGGVLDAGKISGNEEVVSVVAFLAVMGFGAKAGLFPLHAWLPAAHPVAPSPASAVLSGVITKAGVFCIVRVIYYQFGVGFLRGTWVQEAWISVALLTILMGSLMAFREKRLKTRLAYSTVSQLSYILLGFFFLNEIAFAGAMLHVLYHSVLKDGLFLSAGNILYRTRLEQVDDLKGLGRRMPWTLACFTVFSLGLTGIPPFAGFLSKWLLAQGALHSGLLPYSWLAPAILLVSAVLTAGYLFPIVVHGFFPGQDESAERGDVGEAPAVMLGAVLLLAAAAVLLGLFGNSVLAYFFEIADTVF